MTPAPRTPPLRIAQIGLGQIITAHRDGYRRFGLPVVAGFEIAPAGRERLRSEEPPARVYETLDALLADPDVDMYDLATFPRTTGISTCARTR